MHVLSIVVLVIFSVTFATDVKASMREPFAWTALGIFGFTVWLMWPSRLLGKTYRSNPEFTGGIAFSYDDAGFRCESALGESVAPWATLNQVKRSEEMVLLYQRPEQFHPVLRRWFPSEGEWQQFLSKVQQSIERKA